MSVSVHLKHGSGSIRDRSGWLSVEGADIPYIVREAKEKFVPVRAVERDILSFYPSAYPKEIADRPPLVCHYMRPDEVSVLNECCRRRGVGGRFTDVDPVVRLSDFLDFYTIVKQAYPDVLIGGKASTSSAEPAGSGGGNVPDYGWVLIKDALVPYVMRSGSRYAPLNVLRGAAQLFVDVSVREIGATEAEVACLNDMCRNVGLVFTFQKSTRLLDLALTSQLYPECTIHDLPKENPMDFINSIQLAADVASAQIMPVSSTNQLPTSPPTKRHRCEERNQVKSPPATTSSQLSTNTDQNQGPHQSYSPVTEHQSEPCSLVCSSKGQDSSNNDAEETRSEMSNSNADSQISESTSSTKPSTPTGRTAASDAKNMKRHSSVVIEPMECFGRTVSCLLRGKTNVPYALVEAVCRVYFPSCSLVDFIHFLELDLAVTLYVLKRCEEEAFIEFYGIPTKHLRCNQLIKLQDLKDRMGWLQRHFGSEESLDSGEEEAMNDDDENTDGTWQLHSGRSLEDEECLSNITEKESSSPVGTWNGQTADGGDKRSRMLNSESGVKENTPSGSEQNGKNKNLENTIMRILHEKREITVQHTVTPLTGHNKVNTDHYSECRQSNVTSQRPQKVHSVNKRKGVPPRKYLAVNHKKVIVDNVKTET